ncbi:MAG: amidase, partial [Pseudomonadota bacterium]
WVPEADAPMVARLRAAGAIVIGKTNTPEFGLGSQTFNDVFGATRNPWNPARTPGGSSGGAAVALAARMLPMADGSDMMGSLRNPAGWCNVIGFRPSWGRVPNASDAGDLYYHQLSTDGPMGRSVADIALLLDVQGGFDPAAPLSHGKPGVVSPALAAEDPRPWAKGLRIGWLGDWDGRWPMEAGVLDTTRAALGALERLGATVEPVVPDFPWERIWNAWTTLRSWTIAAKFGADHADPARRERLKPEAVWEIERGLALPAMDIHEAGLARADWHRALERVFDDFDLLAMPSAQVWPFPVEDRWPETVAGRSMDTYHRWMEVMLPGSLSGRPTIALPAGLGAPGGPGAGLPIGVQLMGRTRGDLEVLKAAAAYEAEADWIRARPPEPG